MFLSCMDAYKEQFAAPIRDQLTGLSRGEETAIGYMGRGSVQGEAIGDRLGAVQNLDMV